MVQSFVWPKVERLQDASPPLAPLSPLPDRDETDRAVPALPDPSGFVAILSPELSRLFGHRIGLKQLGDAEMASGAAPAAATPLTEVGRLAIGASAGAAAGSFLLAADRASLSRLIERMFGARPEAESEIDTLAGLPPQSGSWLSLARLMGEALARALHSTHTSSPGAPAIGAFTPPTRVAPPAEQPADGLWASDRLLFRLEAGERAGFLSLRRIRKPEPLVAGVPALPEPGTEEPLPVDLPNWRNRARELALALDMPITLRLGELQMPLSRVAALRPGDIVPLARPRSLAVMVSGQKLASLPASLLGGQDASDPDVGESDLSYQEEPR